MHPGYAKGKLLNSQRIAAEFIDFLPKDTMSPETTSGREGYVHLHTLSGTVEETVLKFLVRDFTVEGLKEKEEMMGVFLASLKMKHPRLEYTFSVEESYRNIVITSYSIHYTKLYELTAINTIHSGLPQNTLKPTLFELTGNSG